MSEVTTKDSPHFYIICKKCGSDEMYFKGSGEYDENSGLDIILQCRNCSELNGIEDYWERTENPNITIENVHENLIETLKRIKEKHPDAWNSVNDK